MSGQEEATLDYFDLVVACALKLLEDKPIGTHPAAFWRELVGKEWRNTYQHMTRPAPEFGVWKTEAYRRELALRFAALSRMAAMAAWHIGMEQDDGEDNPILVAETFIQMGTQMAPIIR